jgi:hypothetical protein
MATGKYKTQRTETSLRPLILWWASHSRGVTVAYSTGNSDVLLLGKLILIYEQIKIGVVLRILS